VGCWTSDLALGGGVRGHDGAVTVDDSGGFLSRRADVAVEDRGDTTRGGVRGKNGTPSQVVRGRMSRQRKKGHQMLAPAATGGVFSPFLVRGAGDLGGIKTGTYLGKLLEKFILINFVNFDLRTFLRELLEML
jgi:hypothetical protein